MRNWFSPVADVLRLSSADSRLHGFKLLRSSQDSYGRALFPGSVFGVRQRNEDQTRCREHESQHFPTVSTSGKMCAIVGGSLPVREPPPKTASVAFAGSSWKENAASKDATDAQEGPATKAQK